MDAAPKENSVQSEGFEKLVMNPEALLKVMEEQERSITVDVKIEPQDPEPLDDITEDAVSSLNLLLRSISSDTSLDVSQKLAKILIKTAHIIKKLIYCHTCNKLFKHRQAIANHVAKDHENCSLEAEISKKNNSVCLIFKFNSFWDDDTEEFSLFCFECSTFFSNMSLYRRHRTRIKHVCQFCKKVFGKCFHLKKHRSEFKVCAQLQCTCHVNFDNQELFLEHATKCGKGKGNSSKPKQSSQKSISATPDESKCKNCLREISLCKNTAKCQKMREKLCHLCNITLSSNYRYNLHMIRHHSVTVDKYNKFCNRCGEYTVHKQNHNCSAINKYLKCEDCRLLFGWSEAKLAHERDNKHAKLCKTCNVYFKPACTISKHAELCGKEYMLFTCLVCEKTFLTNSSCIEHLKKVHKRPEYDSEPYVRKTFVNPPTEDITDEEIPYKVSDETQYALAGLMHDFNYAETLVTYSKAAANHSKDAVGQRKDAVNQSKDAVGHSRDAVTHTKDSVDHSNDAATASKDAVTHSKDAVGHSKDAVTHFNDVVIHSDVDVEYQSDDSSSSDSDNDSVTLVEVGQQHETITLDSDSEDEVQFEQSRGLDNDEANLRQVRKAEEHAYSKRYIPEATQIVGNNRQSNSVTVETISIKCEEDIRELDFTEAVMSVVNDCETEMSVTNDCEREMSVVNDCETEMSVVNDCETEMSVTNYCEREMSVAKISETEMSVAKDSEAKMSEAMMSIIKIEIPSIPSTSHLFEDSVIKTENECMTIEESDLSNYVKVEIVDDAYYEEMIEDFEDDLIVLDVKQPSKKPRQARTARNPAKSYTLAKKGTCLDCGVEFPLRSFKRHVDLKLCLANSNDFYSCALCLHNSKSISVYMMHWSNHIGFEKKCLQCSKNFRTFTFMIKHVNIHIKSNYIKQNDKFFCKLCTESIENRFNLLFLHWEQHYLYMPTFDNDFKSKIKTLIDESVLKKDLDVNTLSPCAKEILHNEGTRCRKKKCPGCGKEFDRNNSYKVHLITHLLEEAKDYAKANRESKLSCCLCVVSFDKLDKLKEHLRKHTNAVSYCCKICQKTFSCSSNLAKHKKVHGDNVLQCDLCKRKFTIKRRLLEHMELHKNPTVFNCLECSKFYYFECEYKRHLRVSHRGKQAGFACTICGDKFMSQKVRWEHEFTEHKLNSQYACPYCGHQARLCQGILKHVREVHSVSFNAKTMRAMCRVAKS